jgi:hypothetical protein
MQPILPTYIFTEKYRAFIHDMHVTSTWRVYDTCLWAIHHPCKLHENPLTESMNYEGEHAFFAKHYYEHQFYRNYQRDYDLELSRQLSIIKFSRATSRVNWSGHLMRQVA